VASELDKSIFRRQWQNFACDLVSGPLRPAWVQARWKTIPEQIVASRQPHYSALDAADAAYVDGKIDVTAMEGLLGQMRAVQLSSVLVDAAASSSRAEPDSETDPG
jgi:hypothetical protein